MHIFYDYKIPEAQHFVATYSFGIAPYRQRGDRKVKVSKALIRIVIHNDGGKDNRSHADAMAHELTQLLNAGLTYKGPKQLSIKQSTKLFAVDGFFHQPQQNQ
jgi:hypothetical protein